MGRWGAMDPIRAMQERAADAAHDMQRRVNSPRFQAEQAGEFHSFPDQPEPVHPRSELPEPQRSRNLAQGQFRPLHMTAQGIMDTHQGLAGDRRMVPDVEQNRSRPETHEEFWSRKAQEHEDSGYAHTIRREGYDTRYPISLRDPRKPGHIETARPEILGGHHRLAQMVVEQPNRLLPVRQFGSTQEAKERLGRKY
jgi:hypothetical protein